MNTKYFNHKKNLNHFNARRVKIYMALNGLGFVEPLFFASFFIWCTRQHFFSTIRHLEMVGSFWMSFPFFFLSLFQYKFKLSSTILWSHHQRWIMVDFIEWKTHLSYVTHTKQMHSLYKIRVNLPSFKFNVLSYAMKASWSSWCFGYLRRVAINFIVASSFLRLIDPMFDFDWIYWLFVGIWIGCWMASVDITNIHIEYAK